MSKSSVLPFLEWLVSTNSHASAVILLIIALQLLLKKQLKSGWGYFLWLIIVTRLLMPVPLVIEIPGLIDQQHSTHISNQINAESSSISLSSGRSNTEKEVNLRNDLPTGMNSIIFLFWIWFAGVVLMLLKYLFSLRNCVGITNRANATTPLKLTSILKQTKESLSVNRNIKLRVTDEIQSPASFGIIRPVILLPSCVLGIQQNQLQMILAHELFHHKRGDIALTALMELVKIIHWFNPLIWLAQARMKEDCELSCDARVTRLFTKDERHGYASLLVSFAAPSVHSSNLSPVSTMSGSFKTLKNRIVSLKQNQSKNPAQHLQISICFVLVALIGLTFPAYSSLQSQTIELSENTVFTMQHIPEGSFYMGSDEDEVGRGLNESPKHHVTVKPFYMGMREVTFNEWDLCVDEGGCNHRSDDYGWGRKNRPVIDVSWDDIQQYIKWLSQRTGEQYRLPSEAEWEYAARAETTTAYWWGNEVIRGYANCDECGSLWDDRQTAPVGAFKANDFGLYDTAGNVWEWVEDCWHKNYVSAPNDGSVWRSKNNGDCDVRMVRGGSWDYFPDRLRSAERSSWDANFRYYNFVGFRLAKNI